MATTVEAVVYDYKPQDLAGKGALVTGGTKGIGRAIAVALAARGTNVFTFGRHEQDLNEAIADIEKCANRAKVHGITADQAKREEVRRVFDEADRHLGKVDILINNAALPGDTVEKSGDDWEYVVATNLNGYMWCAEEAVLRMKQNGGGQIVNIGSLSAKSRGAGSDVYVATKSAVRGFSESLSKGVVEDNIRVSLIEPGKVSTNFFDWSKEERDKMTDAGKAMKSEDIAECVMFCLTMPQRCLLTMLQIKPFKDND